MKKQVLSIIVCLLVTVIVQAAEVSSIIALSSDGSENSYELATVQRIMVGENSMIIEREGADVLNVRCVIFAEQMETSLIAPDFADVQLFVYPNPVAEVLCIDGVEAGSVFSIYDLHGHLLMQTLENQFDVSMLIHGSYLIKINDCVVKFVKK